jgi:hypothetical protein
VAVGDGLPKGDALGAGADGVGGVLDIGAVDVLAVEGEYGGADAESRVGAVGGGFGGPAARVQRAELRAGEGVLGARLRDVGGFAGGEELHGDCGVGGGGRWMVWIVHEGQRTMEVGDSPPWEAAFDISIGGQWGRSNNIMDLRHHDIILKGIGLRMEISESLILYSSTGSHLLHYPSTKLRI